MKRLYTIIFAIILLTGWVGCQTADTEKSVTQTELIAMQGNYRVASYSDASSLYLWLQDKDGNVKELSVKKEDVSSVKEEHGQVVIVFKDGSRVTFYFVAYIDVTMSASEVSLAKTDSAAVTFTIKTEEPEKLKVEVLNATNVNAALHLTEGNAGGSVSFSLKSPASFKEDVVVRFDNGQYKVEETISVSRLRFGFADGSDKATFFAVGEEKQVRIQLLGEISYSAKIEDGCDWVKVTGIGTDFLELEFTANERSRRSAVATLTSKEQGAIELTIVQTMSQKAILTKFYEAMDGDNWVKNTNWCTGDNLSDWYGVSTKDGNHVTGLNLCGNHLSGRLPDEIYELPYLEVLVLDSPKHHNTLDDENKNDWNLISGELSPKIAQLTKLKELNFRGLVGITCGDIPDELWMPQLERIDLCQLSIKGRITPAVGNAVNLKYLDINKNHAKTDLRGTIPDEITRLGKLEYLGLGANEHLTGPIPENIGDMESLKMVRLNMCALTGTIPESIFKLKNLYSFNVHNNFLEGEFDLSRLAAFPNLRYFEIDYNMFLQGVGEVPEFIERVNFNRDNSDICYEYGVLTRNTEPAYYNTPEMLEERLSEK